MKELIIKLICPICLKTISQIELFDDNLIELKKEKKEWDKKNDNIILKCSRCKNYLRIDTNIKIDCL